MHAPASAQQRCTAPGWAQPQCPRPRGSPTCPHRRSTAGSAASRSALAPAPAGPTEPPPPPPRARPKRQPQAAAGDRAADVRALIAATQLSAASAERLLGSRARFPSIPHDAAKLHARVRHLQQLLGASHADAALLRYPNLASFSPETLALNLSQWQTFFGGSDGDGAADGAAQQQHHHQQQEALLQRLVRKPQLLGVDVERQVGNLYEAGVLLHAQDLHAFAWKVMDLALMQPQVLQDKMRSTLAFLNARYQLEQQQQQQHAGAGTSSSSSSSMQMTGLARMDDVAKAARRDHSWLSMTPETLQQRLLDLQAELKLPWGVIGRMFLQQPSIINKRPALLGRRAAALQAMPGLGPDRALAALVAFPTLLQLSDDVLCQRWRQLQEAAGTHPAWRERLEDLPPASLASALAKSQARYDRLAEVAQLGYQDRCSFVTVLGATEQAYSKLLAKCAAGGTARGRHRRRGGEDGGAASA